ncbi:MAG: glycine C-acetyltransferase, partial [Planctomycetota bacterium]
MYSEKMKATFQNTLEEIREAGLTKEERVIISPQSAEIVVQPKSGPKQEVLNFCANNYLGLANNKKLIEAAREGLEKYGF